MNPAAVFLLIAHGLVYRFGQRMRTKNMVAYFGAQFTLAVAIGLFVESLWSMAVLLGALIMQAAVLLYHHIRSRKRA